MLADVTALGGTGGVIVAGADGTLAWRFTTAGDVPRDGERGRHPRGSPCIATRPSATLAPQTGAIRRVMLHRLAAAFALLLTAQAPPPPPAALAPYVKDGRFDPGDYGWMRGSFADATPAQKDAVESAVGVARAMPRRAVRHNPHRTGQTWRHRHDDRSQQRQWPVRGAGLCAAAGGAGRQLDCLSGRACARSADRAGDRVERRAGATCRRPGPRSRPARSRGGAAGAADHGPDVASGAYHGARARSPARRCSIRRRVAWRQG